MDSLQKLAQTVNLTRWGRQPEDYFNDCLQIEPKQGSNCALQLNTHQKAIQKAIDEQRAAGKPVRIIILKPRQTGISTTSCANLFHSVRFHKGTGMVVSKDGDSTEHIFGIVQRFYHYLPAHEKRQLRTEASSRKELKFSEPHGGRIVIVTAGAKTGAGHSFTIRHLLLSEVSRWPDGCENTIIGLLNAIPDGPETIVIIESVANGMSGWFYEEWHKKDSDYIKVFLPWFEHSEYQRELPYPDRARYEANLDDTEKRLIADHNLSLEQIEWRRWCIRNKCKGNLDIFKEQYPATAREAFVASGNTFFHIPTLESINTREPILADLRVFKGLSGAEEIKAVPNERGIYRIWRKPQPGVQYVIGADPAEGIEIEGAPQDDKHDYSAADVLDRNTGEQVAQIHARLTPDEFGRQIALLGRFYNHAFIGVETNAGYGTEVINSAKREKYPAGNFYRDLGKHEPGWKTTRANRKELMANLDMAIRAHDIYINSGDTIEEMRSFVVKPDGRIEHGAGKKDDRVFSLAIATKILEAAPYKPLESGDNLYTPRVARYQRNRSLLERVN